jgi:hypothetical protein
MESLDRVIVILEQMIAIMTDKQERMEGQYRD